MPIICHFKLLVCTNLIVIPQNMLKPPKVHLNGTHVSQVQCSQFEVVRGVSSDSCVDFCTSRPIARDMITQEADTFSLPTGLAQGLAWTGASRVPDAGNCSHPLASKGPPPLQKANIFLSYCHSPSAPPYPHFIHVSKRTTLYIQTEINLIKPEISKAGLITWPIHVKPRLLICNCPVGSSLFSYLFSFNSGSHENSQEFCKERLNLCVGVITICSQGLTHTIGKELKSATMV